MNSNLLLTLCISSAANKLMKIPPTTAGSSLTATSNGAGQQIVIDTDLFGDVDDAGALTIANVLHNCGLADLKGIVLNTQSQYGHN